MPAITTHDTLIRQLEMLQLIPKSPSQITVAELTEKLEAIGYHVTSRTVQRDLNDIRDALPQLNLTCNDMTKPYGWKWSRDAKTYFHFMSMEEALTLYLVNQHLKKVLPPTMLDELRPLFNQAQLSLAKLSNKNRMTHWLNSVVIEAPTQPLIAPEINFSIQKTIYQAVFEQKQLEVSYQGIGISQPKKMRLHPIGILVRGNVSYLGATANDYTEIRLFAMHRFASAQLKELDDADSKATQTWQDYLANGAAGFGADGDNEINLNAWVDNDLANILQETPLSADQQLTKQDKGYQLQATVHHTWQLTWWILSQWARIRIDEPTFLREEIYQKLTQAKERYDS
jgi:predicted DNA-binding transcriptional regulator YafY